MSLRRSCPGMRSATFRFGIRPGGVRRYGNEPANKHHYARLIIVAFRASLFMISRSRAPPDSTRAILFTSPRGGNDFRYAIV
ncbi:hypothetical protein EVAR_84791_1 [Eumeta japonica]|uniref:Uncharacterized protein n=1 Tax=Eumeta variegata TaxID=151549 RepID=A0A4C1U808_EUMVA|nr:hypothetical protein EVAR_84791_1 [Eumeta japonica]